MKVGVGPQYKLSKSFVVQISTEHVGTILKGSILAEGSRRYMFSRQIPREHGAKHDADNTRTLPIHILNVMVYRIQYLYSWAFVTWW